MSTYHPTPEKDSDQYRPRYIAVGTDATGADHVYRTTDETMHVVADGRRTMAKSLDPLDPKRDVDAWMATIAESRGWETRHLYETVADALTAGLDE